MQPAAPPDTVAYPPLLDEYKLAEMLDVPVEVVRRWRVSRQKGPRFLRLDRSIYKYRLCDVLAWLESRQRGGEPVMEAEAQ
jgi:hypothetical protein